jgi:hypothetical protein
MIYDLYAAEAAAGRSVYGPIERMAGIEHSAHISAWASDPEIAAYSTWQVQQLRRVMRLLRRTAWRDSLIRADELDELTVHILRDRGAIV